ncbi:MAG: hypothetical protein SPJ89_07715 [Treponema sp.]|nr:hypothetical protein [Spirochaetia bacterium]MDD7459108.1 hypothetical protein [Spirochaetales bacterium]MDY5811852.1 hypothetical protein [Treponema sp.]
MKSLRKPVLVMAAVLTLALADATAKNHPKHQKENFDDHSFPEHDFDSGRHMNHMKMPPLWHNENLKAEVIMGTVKASDAKAQTITLADSNGKEFTVHVNPMTKIVKCQKNEVPADCPPNADGKNKRPAKIPCFNKLKLSDIAAGTWVCVKEFNTAGGTHEAARIKVFDAEVKQ